MVLNDYVIITTESGLISNVSELARSREAEDNEKNYNVDYLGDYKKLSLLN